MGYYLGGTYIYYRERKTYNERKKKLKYKMTVIIADTNAPQRMTSDIVKKLNASFEHVPKQYGDGYYVIISGDMFCRQVIDL